jgi:hypothetical protein
MNSIVIKTTSSQVQTGVSQLMGYLRDTESNAKPNDLPVSTSNYGKKFGKNDKIGL